MANGQQKEVVGAGRPRVPPYRPANGSVRHTHFTTCRTGRRTWIAMASWAEGMVNVTCMYSAVRQWEHGNGGTCAGAFSPHMRRHGDATAYLPLARKIKGAIQALEVEERELHEFLAGDPAAS
jgi:hypothetical protein